MLKKDTDLCFGHFGKIKPQETQEKCQKSQFDLVGKVSDQHQISDVIAIINSGKPAIAVLSDGFN